MDLRSIDQRKKDLNDVGNNFFPWMLRADGLITSAMLLHSQCIERKYSLTNLDDLDRYEEEIEKGTPGSKVHSIILMLWAMAAECLLKALWLKSGEELFKNGQYYKIPRTSDHRLDQIACIVSKKRFLSFSNDEIDILARLSNYITIGRYPVPKNATIRIVQMPDGSTGRIDDGWKIPSDDETYIALVKRMWNTLDIAA